MDWQITLLQNLEGIRTPLLTALIEGITFLAEASFIGVVILILYWCIDKKYGERLAFVVLLSATVNGIFKNIFRAPRPFQLGIVTPVRVETATSYSFPSGHTQSATSFWGTLIYKQPTKLIGIIGCSMIVLIAFSRLYLGVHWPIDVIGSIVIGSLCVFVGNKLLDHQKGMTPLIILMISIIALGCMIFPIDTDLAKSIAALWGLALGLYLENKYIQFNPLQPLNIQIKKVALGLAGAGILYFTFKGIPITGIYIDMIRYSLLALWVSAGAPYVFKIVFSRKK